MHVINQNGKNMKKFKIAQVVGVLLLLFGVIAGVGGENYGMYFVLLGIIIYAFARVMTWLKSDKA